MNIIETENLSYKYDESHFALSDLSIGFEKGKITTILGANGAGKSTLFLNMNGILKPHSGTVKFMGKPIGYSKKEIRELRKSVGIVFQDPDDQLFSASVFQDVSFGAMNLKLPQDEVVHLTENALKRTGIFDLKDKPTHALSFGQKKRAAIAGILVMSPEVIILDEPTAGLDPMGVSELMHLLRDICENEGTTIIMSTHDIDVVPIYSDYVYVINHGKLLTDGTPEEVFSNPTLLREHNLRLPRIAHLLEILNKCDKLNVDFSKATIGKAREEILEVHSRKKKLADDVDLKVIAKNTSGFAGADLENVLNEAALLAARRNYKEIGMKEIEDAMVKVTMGPEKKTRVRSEKENRLVAYHEAGHAVVSRYLPTQDPVHQISIIPRGMAGGYTMYRPTEDKSFMSKTEMEENIVSLLGGRVAEALILNDISTGASNDIERASQIARNMVTKYGMSEKVGTVMFGGGEGEVFLGRDFAQTKDYSEETAALIDEEVKRIVQTAYEKAVKILTEHVDKLHAVAGVLMEKEKIEGEEFDNIFKE